MAVPRIYVSLLAEHLASSRADGVLQRSALRRVVADSRLYGAELEELGVTALDGVPARVDP